MLEEGEYISLMPDRGIIQSGVFPGLWLTVEALLAGDMSEVLKTLQTRIVSSDTVSPLVRSQKSQLRSQK